MRDFNFFRSYTDTKKATKDKYFFSITAIVVFTAVIIGIYLYNLIVITMMNNEIAGIYKFVKEPENIKRLQAYVETKEKNEIMNSYYEELSVVNLKVYSKARVNSELLTIINAAMPKDVFTETMTVDSKAVQIQGIATNRSIIAQFQHNLSEESTFKNVVVNSIGLDSEDSTNYIFVLKCELGVVE